MKRQRVRNAEYRELLDNNDAIDTDDQRQIQMQRQRRIRQENTLEAQIQPGDTLQAIALRYNCTISDLKRLNKIEKEIEIHARKTIKVPINAHTILLSTANSDELPIVHKSGQNSPHHLNETNQHTSTKDLNSIASTSHQLPNTLLDEKLLVASVSLAANNVDRDRNGNTAHLNALSRNHLKGNANELNRIGDDDDEEFNFTDPLIAPLAGPHELYTTTTSTTTTTHTSDHDGIQSGPHAIRGAPRSEFTCSGSDCDISWICLLIFILALCFAIPLIYIIYIAEHPEQFHHAENEQFGIAG